MKNFKYILFFIVIFSNQALGMDLDYICSRHAPEMIEDIKYYKNKKNLYDYTGTYTAYLKISDNQITFQKLTNIYKPIQAKYLNSHFLNLKGLKSRSGHNLGVAHTYDYFKSTEKSHLDLNGKHQSIPKEYIYFQFDQKLEDILKNKELYLWVNIFKSPISMKFEKIKNTNLNTKIYPPTKKYSIHDVMNYPPAFFSKQHIHKKFQNYQCKIIKG